MISNLFLWYTLVLWHDGDSNVSDIDIINKSIQAESLKLADETTMNVVLWKAYAYATSAIHDLTYTHSRSAYESEKKLSKKWLDEYEVLLYRAEKKYWVYIGPRGGKFLYKNLLTLDEKLFVNKL